MNVPVRSWLDKVLKKMGSDSTLLGSASMGLIAAQFSPSPALVMGDITEATYSGYKRQSIGTPSITFTGSDGLEYIEGLTCQFAPNDTVTVNTIYGVFLTSGSDSATIILSDALSNPIGLPGPSRQITITPRVGFDANNGNFGLNVVSS